jgi:hypothetical protein
MIVSFQRTGAARLTRRRRSTRGSRHIGRIRRRRSRTRPLREPACSAIRAPAFAGTPATRRCSVTSPDVPMVATACRCARLCRRSRHPGTFCSSRRCVSRTRTSWYVTACEARPRSRRSRTCASLSRSSKQPRPRIRLYKPGSVPLAIGTPTMLPHSVQEPS